MNKELLAASLKEKGNYTFARSGGPGGQNVNKVNTKARLQISLEALEGLSEAEKARLRDKLSSRIDKEGQLYVVSEETRSQDMNREISREKLLHLIEKALYIPKKRKKTRPTKASVERRLESKKRHSRKKETRGRYDG